MLLKQGIAAGRRPVSGAWSKERLGGLYAVLSIPSAKRVNLQQYCENDRE
jgi:hypothetical protein